MFNYPDEDDYKYLRQWLKERGINTTGTRACADITDTPQDVV